MSNPYRYQSVEILVDGNWVPATFYATDFIAGNDCEVDEVWWMDYFALEDQLGHQTGDTIPEDIHSGEELPQWREKV